MRRTGTPSAPTGLARIAFRLPIVLYRWHLGFLLGGRFVLLETTGRTSGLTRRAVVEVVGGDPVTGAVTVASGFGPGSDWYRNLLADPAVTFQVGRRRHTGRAVPLGPEQGGEAMVDYARRRARAATRLARFMGFEVDGSASDYRAMGAEIPFVRLEPDGAPHPRG